jgi:UDP-N-acetylglucosamine--N-acetylmuramyl-(pentapeptide) pyrophosphoryl-undecaprenol N-acetylglucosamine transferase
MLVVRFVCDKAFEVQSRGIMAQLPVPVVVSTITAGKFRRYAHMSILEHFKHPSIVFNNLIDIFKVAIGFLQSLWIIAWFQPDVVFAKGGYVCLPMGIAAWVLRKPLIIHDSDSRPGLTNKVLARFASKIATGFPLDNYNYAADRSVYTGVPIDSSFKPVSDKEQRRYKADIGVDEDKPLIIAFGGGLGAVSINDAMPPLAKLLKSTTVYNITGKANIKRAEQRGEGVANYRPVDFVYGIHKVMAAADLVITRASATALQELSGLAKPVIAVPARQLGDQLKNADVFVRADAVVKVSDSHLKDDDFGKLVSKLMDDAERRQELSSNIRQFSRPEAAKQIAQMIVDYRD